MVPTMGASVHRGTYEQDQDMRRNRLLKWGGIGLSVSVALVLVAVAAGFAFIPFFGYHFKKEQSFSERLQDAAAQIRRAEQRLAKDPAFKARPLVDDCRPPFGEEYGPCLFECNGEKLLTVAVVVGFLRPRGWYLYKRLGDPAGEVEKPSVAAMEAARWPPASDCEVRMGLGMGKRVSAGRGWWLRYSDD